MLKNVIFLIVLFFSTTLLFAQQRQSSSYIVRHDLPRQIIWGLGVEVQNDAIGSNNNGMPNDIIAIPHNLVQEERLRLYNDLLKGFRYLRLPIGLYFRGTDKGQKQIVERYPHQIDDLKELITKSGMEGISMEYFSPAPYWKSTKSFIGGGLNSFDDKFLNSFSNALVKDVQYFRKSGIKISMWGLQNEAAWNSTLNYAHCIYNPHDYLKTFKVTAPKIKKEIPDAIMMVDSWDGQSGENGKLIIKDSLALKYVDAWVYHRIGTNSNIILWDTVKYRSNTFGKPVFNNEFEYDEISDETCLNTAQNIMTWFCFMDSPTWFWLHMLKPTTNSEAKGYSLGFWRPQTDNDFSKYSHIKKGHWDYNPQNYNSIAGFLKYMPWNSRRYHVYEDTIRKDNRIMAFKTPQNKLVLVITNRSGKPFEFVIDPGLNEGLFNGHRFTPSSRDVAIGSTLGKYLNIIVPNNCIEFWVEQ